MKEWNDKNRKWNEMKWKRSEQQKRARDDATTSAQNDDDDDEVVVVVGLSSLSVVITTRNTIQPTTTTTANKNEWKKLTVVIKCSSVHKGNIFCLNWIKWVKVNGVRGRIFADVAASISSSSSDQSSPTSAASSAAISVKIRHIGKFFFGCLLLYFVVGCLFYKRKRRRRKGEKATWKESSERLFGSPDWRLCLWGGGKGKEEKKTIDIWLVSWLVGWLADAELMLGGDKCKQAQTDSFVRGNMLNCVGK